MKKVLRLLFILACLVGMTLPVFSSTTVNLSAEEKAFIAEHPVIKLGVDPSFVPYEFIDTDQSYQGIAKDYLDLISQKTGLTFEIAKGLTWEQAYEKAVLKELDGLPIVGKSDERAKYFLFSEAYYSFQRVLFVSDANTTIQSFNDLEGKRVAVQKNSSHHEYLKTLTNIQISLYDTVEEAITAVSNGTETAFVGNLATTLYLSKKAGISQLKYIAIPSQNRQNLYFAARIDYPILISIVNKGLAAITESERIAIDNRWIGVIETTDYTWLIQLVLLILLVIVIILLVSWFWIHQLRIEIQHRKQAEAESHEAKLEAERANQVKSSFLARMSHEIRTPLNAISGMAYILRKSGLTLTQQNYLDKISIASKDVLEIINDILDFSKIEAGKVELESTSFNFDEILEHLISIVSFKVEEQHIDFKVERDPAIPMYFFGDPKRLQQILLNILNNSVKFTQKGSVRMDLVCLKKEGDQVFLSIAIADTGIGMTADQVERLFVPFAQADTSINRRFGGTGLGLSIVKSLLDLMGGTIRIDSSPDVGSTFTIELSLKEDVERMHEQRQLASKLYLGDIKTLILDKTEVQAKMIQDYLKSFNLVTDIFTDEDKAQEAIANAFNQNHPYHLLILDYDTPLKKGIEFSLHLNSQEWISQSLKIILLIPFNTENVFERLDEAGIGFGLHQPIIPSVLFNGIIDLFRQDVYQKVKGEPVAQEEQAVTYDYSILLCEDNKTNQFIAQSLLEQAGYRITLAENGQVGVDLFKQNPDAYDIVLMDLHMPILNGFEATKILLDLKPGLKVVAMTADAISGIDEKCREVGINDYITKPFDPATLAKTVAEMIEPQKKLQTAVPIAKAPKTSVVLDEAQGLKNIGGNLDLYHNILKIFLEEGHQIHTELQTLMAQKDYANAAQQVHKIKGSCGTIGANGLYDLAIDLQKALKDHAQSDIETLYPAFDALLTQVLMLIKNQ